MRSTRRWQRLDLNHPAHTAGDQGIVFKQMLRNLLPACLLEVEPELSGTLGVFFSVSGYSRDAVDALVSGKELNLILFDGDDLREMARPGGPSVEEALDLKLRAAAEEGTPMFPLHASVREASPSPCPFIMVVVEGAYDAEAVSSLVQRVSGPTTVAVTPATGRINLPLVALAQLSLRRRRRRRRSS